MNADTHESLSTTGDKEDNHKGRHLEMAVKELREHMGLPINPGDPLPDSQPTITALFFIERAPGSNRGARCKLPFCSKGPIRPGDYRVALSPSMDLNNYMRGREGTADFYHVSCFEDIADFSQVPFLGRVTPVTRYTFQLRGIKGSSILDGNYLVDGGAERLLLQWKVERGRQIDERDGRTENSEPLAQNFANLLNMAGSPGFKGEKPQGMTDYEYLNLCTSLAPNESDGPEDREVWNLFDQYLLTREPGRLDNRHDLSEMLQAWRADTILATNEEDELDDFLREERAKLEPKAIKALQRLSTIPMPDLQAAFHRGIHGF